MRFIVPGRMRFIVQVDVPACYDDRTEEMSLKVTNALGSERVAEAMIDAIHEATDHVLGDDLELSGAGRISPLDGYDED